MSSIISNNECKMSETKVEDSTEEKSKCFIQQRVYLNRESILTELLRIPHFNSLLNMFFSFIILMLFHTIVTDWLQYGFFEHFHHIEWVTEEFSKPSVVILSLVILYISAISTFVLLKIWIILLLKFKNLNKLIHIIVSMSYLTIIGFIVLFPVLLAINIYIPPCSSAFIVYEQIRMIMKLHAYVRSIVPVLQESLVEARNNNQNRENLKSIMSWSKFLYFMIIPTLIYRDSYPKRTSINYQYVVACFTQFVLCIIFMYYIFIHLMRPVFIDFDSSYLTKEIIIPKLFLTILPTILMMLTLFFCFLHLWLNAFAELTKFGDRQFYKDWWNATSLSDYLRTWNVLIHDWLHTYVYRDIAIIVFKLTKNQRISKSIGTISVLLFSALVHEYVLAYCFRFFYPVLLTVYFLSGTVLYFIKADRTSRISNIMVWLGMYIGNTFFVTLYSLEWYARKNCIRKIDGYLDFFIPRSLLCETI